MKLIKYILFIVAISGILLSCNNEDENNEQLALNSTTRLLPSSTTEMYSTDVYGDERDHVTISTHYTYNDSNLITGISTTAERQTLPSTNTNTVITYNTAGEIIHTETIQTGREENETKTLDKDYIYSANRIEIKQEGSTIGVVELNTEQQITQYTWYDSEKKPITQNYSYDKYGNVVQYTYTSKSQTQSEKYTTENKNGVFKCVSTPQWYLVINYHNGGLFNNCIAVYSSVNNSKFELFQNIEYKYNRDYYPVKRVSSSAPGWIGGSDSTLNIEYIRAKTDK